jgi:hypothetical protein
MRRHIVRQNCTGCEKKCPEPYRREEVLSERFAQLLKALELGAEVVDWVPVRQSHPDEKRERTYLMASEASLESAR